MRRVGELGDLDFRLADADRLDDHEILAEGVHEGDRVAGRPGQPAEMAAASH